MGIAKGGTSQNNSPPRYYYILEGPLYLRRY